MPLEDRELFLEACWVAGAPVRAADGASLAVTNPASGEEIGRVPALSAAEVEAAIRAAAAAFPAWRARTAQERGAALRRWAELLLAHQADLALLITLEGGKPLAEAEGEVAYAASFLDWFGEEARRIDGLVIPSHKAGAHVVVLREPIGVAATITPWNFPAAMITRKIAPALAAGCTVVSKPAEATPFTALALAKLGERAGLPPGVWNVVTGEPARVGAVLTASPLVRVLSFTGSTATGRVLMAQCAPTVKRVALELGGNAPFVVFDDADLARAIEGALVSKYRNSGQTCVCANRFLVQDGIYDAFAAGLAERVQKLQVGDGREPGVQQGPLISAAALAKVEAHVADARAKGAKILCGGRRHARGGNFYEPTVLAEATPAMRCAREETFGPVAPLLRFRDEAEAIRLANDTEFGLAAYLYTRDLARAWRMAEALEVGMLGINEGLISTAVAPFGGVKQSGIGREGSHAGIDEYVELKYVLMGG